MDNTILNKKEKIRTICKKINKLKKRFYSCTEYLKCVEVLFEKSGTKCIKKIKKNEQSPNPEHHRNSPTTKDIFFTGFIKDLDFFNVKNLDIFFDKCCLVNNKYNDKKKHNLSNKSNNTEHEVILESSPSSNSKYSRLNSRQPDENEKDSQAENKINEMKNNDIEINTESVYNQTMEISLDDLKNENMQCISKIISNDDNIQDNKRRETKLYDIDSCNILSNKRRKLSEITVNMNDMYSELNNIQEQISTQFSFEEQPDLENDYEKKENYTKGEEDQGIYNKNKYIKKQNLILKISNIIFEGIKDRKGEKMNETSLVLQNGMKTLNFLFENMQFNHDKKQNIAENIKKECQYIANQIDVIVNAKLEEKVGEKMDKKMENKITNYQEDLQKCLMFFNNIFLKLSAHINTLFSTCIELLKWDFSQLSCSKTAESNNSLKVINLINKYQNHQEYVIHFSKYLLQICKIFISRNNSESVCFNGKYIKDIVSKKEIKTIKNLIKILNKWNKIDLNILLKLTQYKMENNTTTYQIKILNHDLVKYNFFVRKGDFLKYNNKIISSLKRICSLLFDEKLSKEINKNINKVENDSKNCNININNILAECNKFDKKNGTNVSSEIDQDQGSGISGSDSSSSSDVDGNDFFSKFVDEEKLGHDVWKYEKDIKSNEMKIITNLNKILTHEMNYHEFIRNATKKEVDGIANIYIYIKKIYNFLEKNNEKGSSLDLPSTQKEYLIINKFREYLLELSINKNSKEIYMTNDTAYWINKNASIMNKEENCHINFSITNDFNLLKNYNIYNNNKVVEDKYSKDVFENYDQIKQNKYNNNLEETDGFKYIPYRNNNDIYNLANMIKSILSFVLKCYIDNHAATHPDIYEENSKGHLYTYQEKLIVNLQENIKQIKKENTENAQKLEIEKNIAININEELEKKNQIIKEMELSLEKLTEENQELRVQVEKEKLVSDSAFEELAAEKGKSAELSNEFEAEKEKCANLGHELEVEKERCVKLADELEEEREKLVKVSNELEAEKEKVAELSSELEAENERSAKLADELETEKGRSAKLSDELEGERERSTKLADELEGERERSTKLADELDEEKEKFVKLVGELEAEKERINKVGDELEAEKEKCAKLGDELEAEKERSTKVTDELEGEKEINTKLADELEVEKENIVKMADELEAEREKLVKVANELEAEKEKVVKVADELETERAKLVKLADELEGEKKRCEEKENKILSQNKELEDMKKMRNDDKDKEGQKSVKDTFFSRFLKKYKKSSSNGDSNNGDSSGSENKMENKMTGHQNLNDNEKDEYGNLYYSHIESVIKNDSLEKEYDKMIIDFNSRIENFNKKVDYFDNKIKYYKNICTNYEKKNIHINNCVDKLEELIIDADEKIDNTNIKIDIQNKIESLKNILKELKENYKIEMIETDSMLFDEILKEKNILLNKINNYKINNIDNEKSEALKKYMKDMNFKTINDLFIFHLNSIEELNLLKEQLNKVMDDCSGKDKELTILNENCKSLLLEVDNLKSILNDLFSYKENKPDMISMSGSVYSRNASNNVNNISQNKTEIIDLEEYCKTQIKNKEDLINLEIPIDNTSDILSNINSELLGSSNFPLASNDTNDPKENKKSPYKPKRQRTPKIGSNPPISEGTNENSPRRYQLRRSTRNK
ncbi:conserved Plasmodium protein, unknown function [Plasmodium vinckei petteri]|uniref:Uncharacterized protein n=1 Tax=Plasmodium vinckei petteri TaxID=138298 RepID=A0A6V7T9S7_PLAVN|nr:conserved Plasmodium protein, unknown function [Plasmodium vinckei petteri]